MRLFFSFFFLLFFSVISFAQPTTNPIIAANNWVSKVDALLKAGKFKTSLNEKWQVNDGGTEVDFIINYSVLHQSFAEGFGLRTIGIVQYEKFVTIKEYFRGGRLFYVLLDIKNEGCISENKIYLDEQEKVIKILQKFNQCSGEPAVDFIELKNQDEIMNQYDEFWEYNRVIEEQISRLFYVKEEDPICYELRAELKQIQSHADLFLFVNRHGPSFTDLDSLYTIITGKTCPPNFSYDLCNGDSSLQAKAPSIFLNILFRNVIWSLDGKAKNYQSIYDYPGFQSLGEQLNKAGAGMTLKRQNDYELTDFALTKMAYSLPIEEITVPMNLKKWYGDFVKFRFTNEYAELPKNPIFTYFVVSVAPETFVEKEKYFRHEAMRSALGNSIYTPQVVSFMSAQVFTDIGFFYINNRWVFFDLSR